MQKRLKEPYFGFYGFITGKVKLGKKIFETAKREFKEETGYSASLTLTGIEHKMDFSEKDNLLEDKFFSFLKQLTQRVNLKENSKVGKIFG
jgi:8-oxo-dGTP pyrophosphatase MutT (NUDIX family)